jgi:Ca-activated chloride channel family protein
LTLRSHRTYNFVMPMLKRLILLPVLIAAIACTALAQNPPPPNAPPATPAAPGATDQQNQPPQAPGQQPLKVTSGLVHLVAAVSDRRHNFITDLDKQDFKILEDGKPQTIQFFGRETDLPLRIAMLLDTSNSIRERLHFEKDAATDFLVNVIRRNKDTAFLMTFDNEPEVIQDWTSDPGTLTEAIQKQRAGGGTSFNDAIYMAAQKLAKAPLPTGGDQEVRRVLVVFSDGEDNLSDRALSDAIEMAERSEVAVYSISTSTEWLATDTADRPRKLFETPGDKILQTLAIETGGRVFFPYKVDDLAVSFQDIGTELRSQYFIAYAPTNPLQNGQYRKIQVDVDRKGLVVRTRKGYYAVAPGATPYSKTQ